MDQKVATLIGMTSIVLWASMVGLIKQVSSLLGVSLGVALVYTVSVCYCLFLRFSRFIKYQGFSYGYLPHRSYHMSFAFRLL